MPEISFFFFDLEQLCKLFPKCDNNQYKELEKYENEAQENMVQIRMNLFSEFGYGS